MHAAGTSRLPAVAGRYRWRVVGILFCIAVVLYLDRINISIAAPKLVAEFALTPVQLGKVLSAFLFGYALGLVPGGYYADRLGPHRLLLGACLSWAMVTTAAAAIPAGSRYAAVSLISLRFLLGLCEACALPTMNRALANWMLRTERARASGWIHCGAGVGGGLTPALVSVLIGSYGWRTAFLFSAALTTAVALWWWRSAADTPEQHASVDPLECTLIASQRETLRPAAPDRAWLRRLARSRELYLLCLSLFFFGVAQFVYVTWFYTYFVQVRRAAELNAALLTSLPYLAIAVASPAGGWLCDFFQRRLGPPWGRRIVPLVSLPAAGVCAFAAPAVDHQTLSALLFAAAAGLQYMAASAYWSTVIDVTQRGTGLLGGFMNGANYLGSALATLALPLSVGAIGWTRSIQLAGLAAAVSASFWLGMHSDSRIDAENTD